MGRVTEVAAFLRRDPAHISMMLLRLSARAGQKLKDCKRIVKSVRPDPATLQPLFSSLSNRSTESSG